MSNVKHKANVGHKSENTFQIKCWVQHTVLPNANTNKATSLKNDTNPTRSPNLNWWSEQVQTIPWGICVNLCLYGMCFWQHEHEHQYKMERSVLYSLNSVLYELQNYKCCNDSEETFRIMCCVQHNVVSNGNTSRGTSLTMDTSPTQSPNPNCQQSCTIIGLKTKNCETQWKLTTNWNVWNRQWQHNQSWKLHELLIKTTTVAHMRWASDGNLVWPKTCRQSMLARQIPCSSKGTPQEHAAVHNIVWQVPGSWPQTFASPQGCSLWDFAGIWYTAQKLRRSQMVHVQCWLMSVLAFLTGMAQSLKDLIEWQHR